MPNLFGVLGGMGQSAPARHEGPGVTQLSAGWPSSSVPLHLVFMVGKASRLGRCSWLGLTEGFCRN